VLPALDEEATVGGVVAAVRPLLGTLVDELVVVDSGSTDATAARAAAAGARVVPRDAVLPEVPVRAGKGEVLWRSLAATSGDLVVFLDSDLVDLGPDFVTHLLGPLLTVEHVALVKGCYARPLRISENDAALTGGGRVTELTARPLLNALWPELAGFVQPLGGEYAGRREVLEQVPFVSGYGVEVGLLIDLLDLAGLGALAQVDLGVRRHSSQSEEALGAMAGQVVSAVLARAECGRPGHARIEASGLLTQFRHDGTGFVPRSTAVGIDERPPMATIPEYLSLQAGLVG
jgi:glucosyl-3-phosphoglycerate synthase